MKVRFLFLVFMASAATGWAQTPVPDAPLSPRSLLPAPPVRSGDNSVTVRSSMAEDRASLRAPVLLFVQQAREAFFRSTRLKLDASAIAIDVLIGNQRDGDTRVLSGRIRLSSGSVCERIELPDPETADLKQLKHCVWLALYRSWLVSTGGSEAVLGRLPVWVMAGAVRRMDTETWPADVDRALLLWSRACLLPAMTLLDADSKAVSLEPALGAVLADYLIDRKVTAAAAAAPTTATDKKDAGMSVLDALIRDAAKGQAWSVEHIARLVTGRPDLVALDADLDLWFASAGRKVLVPGLTTEGTMRRFRANLLLCPSDYGKFFDPRKPCMTFQELAATDDPVMRRAALAHMMKVQMAAVGRDGTLLALADAYSQFLKAVAAGKKPKEVNLLLMNAEAQRKGLEDALKGGRVLQD